MSDIARSFPELSDDDVDDLVDAIREAQNEHAKMDAMEPYVDWGERRQLLWELTRTGALPAWEEPALWRELANGIAWASSGDVVEFLRHIERYDSDDHRSFRLVDYWPVVLDELAVRSYAEDPEPFLEHWRDFPDPVRRGFELVLRRFGQLDREELSTDVLDALARQHVTEGLPMHALLVRNGDPEEVRLHDHGGAEPGLYELIEAFGDREEWKEKMLEYATEMEVGPSFRRSSDAWRAADLSELGELLAESDIPPVDRPELYRILIEERDDEPEELVELARSLRGEGFSGIESEMCAVAAILKWKERGEPVPEHIEELLSFRSLGRPSQLEEYYGLESLIEAVEHLDDERAVDRVETLFDQTLTRLDPFAVLRAVSDDEEVLNRAFTVAQAAATESDADFRTMHPVAYGLALAGGDVLDPVESAFHRAEEPLLRDTYRRAVVHLLAERAKRGQGIEEKWDSFISYVDWESPETDDYNFGHFILDDLTAIVANLPEGRVERLVAPQLRVDSEDWLRALEAIEHHPTDELVGTALERLHDRSIPSTGGSFDWVDRFLRALPESRYSELGAALAASSAPALHAAVKRVFGESQYADLLEEHSTGATDDRSPAEEVRRLAENASERSPDLERTTIYVLESDESRTSDGEVGRVGGAPVGIDDESWPEGPDAEPMEHILTIDLEALPAVADRLEDRAAAVALFLSDPEFNEAWAPDNDDACVRVLTADDLEAGEYIGDLPAGERSTARSIEVTPVEVPTAIFREPRVRAPDERSPVLERLRDAVYQLPARAGGAPLWLDDEVFAEGTFLLQFDEQFADINLGSMGIMYVFAETAFWQSY